MRLNNLAIVAQNIGDLKLAEAMFRDAIRRDERAYGDHIPPTSRNTGGGAVARGNYGLLLQREGRLAEAEPLLRSALDVVLKLDGRTTTRRLRSRVSLAMLCTTRESCRRRNRIPPALPSIREIAAANHIGLRELSARPPRPRQ